MKIPMFILLLLATSAVAAQDYNVALIPDSLKQHANAVKRFESLRVIIKSPGKAVVRHRWAITILNEDGAGHGWYHNSYDQLRSLDDISGKLFDENGKHLKSIKKKEISDLASDDNMSLMTDNRVKQFNFYHKQYPYTVEFEDEETYNGIFYLPAWTPVEADKFSVQQSSFTVEAPEDYHLRYKQYAFAAEPKTVREDGRQILNWNLSNFRAIEWEYFQPSDVEVLPNIRLAPSDFEIQGYKGNMATWFEFGKFRNVLYGGRDVLPQAIKDSVHLLMQPDISPAEKVERLYAFLQRNTRYVSIQLGIGGWQPYDATFVATKKYGDCKALSNYMLALLKEAGIKSNIVAVSAGPGRKGLDESFPSNQFNHIILNVPMQNDTMWLECTDQTQSPGFMGSFTGNRKALMMTEEGGYVVNTPAYTPNDNLQARRVNAVIDADGNLSAQVTTRFTGEQQEGAHRLMHGLSEEERRKRLNDELNLPTYDIKESRYAQTRGRIPAIEEFLSINAPSYASVTGKRLFIQPNLFNKSRLKLTTDKPRRFPIEFRFAYRDVDSIFITIPDGYTAESVPRDVSVNDRFGIYSIRFRVEGNRISMVRSYETFIASFPASAYGDLARHFDEIYKADRGRVVLVKKE